MSVLFLSASLRPRRRRAATGILALVTGGVLLLAGCGSDTPSSTYAPQGGTASQSAGVRPGGAGGGSFTSGLIAEVTGKTMQVQATDSQTAVTYTSTTTISEQTKVSAGAVRVGMCVMVQSADTAGASAATTFTAATVSVSSAVKGECTGRGGVGGPPGPGGPSGRPSGAPSGEPQDGQSADPQGDGTPPGNGSMRRAGVFGKVTAVSGSTLTVARTAPGDSQSQTATVTTTSTTTFTQEKPAKASAIKVGKCATAVGKADSTGSVRATSIALRPATNGTCTFGTGRPAGSQRNG